MSRFASIEYAKPETRRILRDRFGRSLPAPSGNARRTWAEEVVLPDEKLLLLLFGIEIEFENDSVVVRGAYEALRRQHRNAPSYAELIEAGWIREIWGRLHAGRDSVRELQRASPDIQAVLGPILARRYGRHKTSFSDDVKKDPRLGSTISKLIETSEDVYHPHSARPEWVATRLWECASGRFADSKERMRFWIDRWKLIDSPSFIPSKSWAPGAAKSFCETAIGSIASEPGLLSWVQARAFLVNRIARASERSTEEIEAHVPTIPSTLVDRFLWLENEYERLGIEIYHEGEELSGLVNLLLQDPLYQDQSSAPHPTTDSLFRLATERPELLLFTVSTIRRQPVLLADLLLHPATCALACLLIAEWTSNSGAWDRELIEKDNYTAHMVAFTDAAAVAGDFLKEIPSLASEIASLLSWMYDEAGRRRFIVRERSVDEMLRIFRDELLVPQTREVLLKVVAEIVQALPKDGLGTPCFSAALDVVATGGLADTVDPKPFVLAYTRSICNGGYALSKINIDPPGARSLVQLAMRSESGDWKAFLTPINIPALVADAHADSDLQFIRIQEIVRSIRAHVRVLSRAVAGWEEEPPDELLSAMVSTIRSGAIAHAERGRIDAFAAQWEQEIFGGSSDRPIAVDMGEALCALTGASREKTLTAILEIDEPLTLAQLLPVAPPSSRDSIRARISALSRGQAGAVRTLPEIQARIDKLLSVGALEAAKNFMDLELKVKTFGKVSGREVRRLQAELKLHLSQRNFEAIIAAEPPEGLEPADLEAANDSLIFYKALAETSRPGGNLYSAEQDFLRLNRRRPDVAAYVVNLLAARANILLPGNLFGRVSTTDLQRARSFLAEADIAFGRIRSVSDEDRAIHNCNRAVLLLAIGQPERAYETLQSTPRAAETERTAAFSAVALSRLGQNAAALETLRRAEQTFGSTDLLRATRAQVERGTSFDARASTTSNEEMITRVKSALHDLSQMDPIRQAYVQAHDSFDSLAISHVRAASASLIVLVPVLRPEDDITTLMREFLGARIGFLHWSVSDQPRGGFSEKGNAGERDLVLKKEGAELAIVEAILCRQPPRYMSMKKGLTDHFKRLFAYGVCHLFFHVTYCYIPDPGSILPELGRIAKEEVPEGFRFIQSAELPMLDSQPPGFWVRYTSSFGEITVVFLVLDMLQQVQRDAAKAAHAK